MANVTGVGGTAGPIIDVMPGNKVNITDLTVDGGSALAGGVVYGIRYTDADGKVERVEVLNIRNASGASQGIGIGIIGNPTSAKVDVKKSTVSNFTRVGIYANGAGADVKIEDNVVMGPMEPRVWAPNGMQISRGAKADVKKNMVDNNPSPNPPGGTGSGILAYCAGHSKIENNTVTSSDTGISLTDTQGADAKKNAVSSSNYTGIAIEFLGNYFGDLGCPGHPVAPTNNKVKDNTVTGGAPGGTDDGIDVYSDDTASNPVTPNNNEIKKNNVSGVAVDGIHVWNGSDNKLEDNTISGSGGTDAVDDTVGGGTAGTANTWKKNSCATSAPPGLCS